MVLDSRPFDEYSRVSIPTATNVPGAELVLRAREIAPSPETMVVVNCAGRTRSIIGAQSLINAGLPNKVVALAQRHDGLEPRRLHLRQRKRPARAATFRRRHAAGRAKRRGAWRKVAASSASIVSTLEAWRNDTERTLYLFDVRDPAEYEAGHVAGAISAPGGQLVQATDQYVGTLGARIVLVDDAEVARGDDGIMAAADGLAGCLRAGRDGDRDRLAGGADARNRDAVRRRHRLRLAQRASVPQCGDRRRSFAQPQLSQRGIFRRLVRDHGRGSRRALEKIPPTGTLVLTSEDGVVAQLAVPEAAALTDIPVRALDGGNRRVAGGRL